MSELLQIVQRRRKPLLTEPVVCPHCGKRADEPVAVVSAVATTEAAVAVAPAVVTDTPPIAEPVMNQTVQAGEVSAETVAAPLGNVPTKKSRAKAASH